MSERILLRNASSASIMSLILSRAYIAVVWSFLPNSRAICGNEAPVSCHEMYIAT